MKNRSELLYTVFLLTAVSAIFYCLLLLFQKFTVGSLIYTAVDTCCQLLVRVTQTGVQVAGMSILYLMIFAFCFLSFKTIFSLIKTTLMARNVFGSKVGDSNSLLVKICQKHAISVDRIVISNSPTLAVYTTGILKPQILISDALIKSVSASELEAILLHEFHHLQHYHPALFLTGEVISRSFSFIPLIREFSLYFKLKLESEADIYASTMQGTSYHLQQALRRLSGSEQLSEHFYPAFSAYSTHERLERLQGDHRSKLPVTFSSVLSTSLIVFFVILLLKTPIYAQEGQTESSARGSYMCQERTESGSYCRGAEKPNQSRISPVSSEVQ